MVVLGVLGVMLTLEMVGGEFTTVVFALVTGPGVVGSCGVTWTDHTNNLAPRDVASLAVSSDGSAVFAGTRGGGVLRLVR